MKLQESGENYLETILLLQKKKGTVRSIDIANELDYSKPSISRAMSILRQAGFITVGEFGQIELTEAGRARASEIYSRHRTITSYFVHYLDVDPEIAEHDACRIEHVISPVVIEKMKAKLIADYPEHIGNLGEEVYDHPYVSRD